MRAFYSTDRTRSKRLVFHVKHSGANSPVLLANAEVPEDHIQNILDVDPAGEAAQSARRKAQLLGDDILARRARLRHGPTQCRHRVLERAPVPRTRNERGLTRPKVLPRMLREHAQKFIESGLG